MFEICFFPPFVRVRIVSNRRPQIRHVMQFVIPFESFRLTEACWQSVRFCTLSFQFRINKIFGSIIFSANIRNLIITILLGFCWISYVREVKIIPENCRYTNLPSSKRERERVLLQLGRIFMKPFHKAAGRPRALQRRTYAYASHLNKIDGRMAHESWIHSRRIRMQSCMTEIRFDEFNLF